MFCLKRNLVMAFLMQLFSVFLSSIPPFILLSVSDVCLILCTVLSWRLISVRFGFHSWCRSVSISLPSQDVSITASTLLPAPYQLPLPAKVPSVEQGGDSGDTAPPQRYTDCTRRWENIYVFHITFSLCVTSYFIGSLNITVHNNFPFPLNVLLLK